MDFQACLYKQVIFKVGVESCISWNLEQAHVYGGFFH